MKKVLSLILSMLMLISAIPFTAVSADDASLDTVYGPLNFDAHMLIGSTGINFTVETEDGKTFYHGVSQPGVYKNHGLVFNFSTPEFNIIDYPYIKMSYRSNTENKKLDISSASSVGESWMNSDLLMQGDEKWHEVIISLKDITGGGGPIPAGDAEALLRIKPYNDGEVTLNEETYIDVEYLACFKTEAEAKAFVYTGEKPVGEIEYYESTGTEEVVSEPDDEELLLPITAETANIDENAPATVYGPLNFDAYQLIGSTGIEFTATTDGERTYYHGISKPGVYKNHGLVFNFSSPEFKIIDYPYIKMSYRSNTNNKTLDISSGSTVGESWMKKIL